MRYIKSTVTVYWISEYCKRECNSCQCSMLYTGAVHWMCYVTLNKEVMLIHEWLHSKMTMHDGNCKRDGGNSIVANYSRVCSCTQHISSTMSVQKQCHVYMSKVVALLSRLHTSVRHPVVLLLLARVSNIERKERLTLYRAV